MRCVLACVLLSVACRPASAPRTPRDEAEAAAERACALVRTFAAEHGWGERMTDCFYDDVQVFDDQEALFEAVRAEAGLAEDYPLPRGVVAALEGRHLRVVTPEIYAEVMPDYAAQDDAWTRLMAHEIGHRLHVAILDGDEEAMGPQWFYEGFAVVAAGQKLGAPLTYRSAADALAGAREEGELAYRRFGAAVRYFETERAPLPTLVDRAGDEGFETWLARGN